ncbi:MAG: ATPase [Synergistetes bacterium]|nr:ATPase [Synergistota bacterium]
MFTLYAGLTIRRRKDYKAYAKKVLLFSSVAILASVVLLFLLPVSGASAAPEESAISIPRSIDIAAGYIGAAVAVGAAAIGAGIAVAATGSAMIGVMAEKPELIGRAMIVVALAEGIAIYGMIIAIMILAKL